VWYLLPCLFGDGRPHLPPVDLFSSAISARSSPSQPQQPNSLLLHPSESTHLVCFFAVSLNSFRGGHHLSSYVDSGFPNKAPTGLQPPPSSFPRFDSPPTMPDKTISCQPIHISRSDGQNSNPTIGEPVLRGSPRYEDWCRRLGQWLMEGFDLEGRYSGKSNFAIDTVASNIAQGSSLFWTTFPPGMNYGKCRGHLDVPIRTCICTAALQTRRINIGVFKSSSLT
jgi:hypothetical protein